MPSARQLYEQVRLRITGCDQQIKTMSSRISLAVARAEMLARGVQDTGVGAQTLLVSGNKRSLAIREKRRATPILKAFGKRRLAHITASDIHDYVARRKNEDGLKNRSINLEISSMVAEPSMGNGGKAS